MTPDRVTRAQVQSRFAEPEPQPGWPANFVDLHTHSDRSDGVLPPADLYRQMAECGLAVAALADHDTLAGYRMLRVALAAGTPAPGPRVGRLPRHGRNGDRGH